MLGTACHDVAGRTLAASGVVGPVALLFAAVADVPGAGVLCAIPALVANGFIHGAEARFVLPPGYYPLSVLVLLFAFLALARVQLLERVRYLSPGSACARRWTTGSMMPMARPSSW